MLVSYLFFVLLSILPKRGTSGLKIGYQYLTLDFRGHIANYDCNVLLSHNNVIKKYNISL